MSRSASDGSLLAPAAIQKKRSKELFGQDRVLPLSGSPTVLVASNRSPGAVGSSSISMTSTSKQTPSKKRSGGGGGGGGMEQLSPDRSPSGGVPGAWESPVMSMPAVRSPGMM